MGSCTSSALSAPCMLDTRKLEASINVWITVSFKSVSDD